MMLRGGEGQKEGRAVLRHTLFSGPRVHQGKAGLTYQKATRASRKWEGSMGLWGLHWAWLSFSLLQLQGTMGHCRRNSGEPQGSPPHHGRREALRPSTFALFYHFLLFKQN